MTKNTGYRTEAKSDARDMATEFLDQIVEQLCDNGKASDDILNDYANGDSYHHESHVDKSYNLLEAAELLDELDDYEETDNGLWEGLSPRDAIAAQAAYTYGNAVNSKWSDLIGEINGDSDIEGLLDELRALDEDEAADEDEDEEQGADDTEATKPTKDEPVPAKRTSDEIRADIQAAVEAVIERF